MIGSGVTGDGRTSPGQSEPPVYDDLTYLHTKPPPLLAMQSLVARQAVLRPSLLRSSGRTFATSSVRAQAVPTEKPVLKKEFKIYRWVRRFNECSDEDEGSQSRYCI